MRNPLPQQYLTSTAGVGGVIKQRPADFLVEELPKYEPQGEGEHLYLLIEKQNVAHHELVQALCQQFNVRESAIGYAGMKDKVAITRQMMSIYLPGAEAQDANVPQELDKKIKVLWAERHRNKLRRGHLAGNRFSIRIRDVDPMKAPQVLQTIRKMEQCGAPDFFGPQRFGHRHSNHDIGALLLQNRWDDVVRELVGIGPRQYSESQHYRRELFEQGKLSEAAKEWQRRRRPEARVVKALQRSASAREAVFAVGKSTLVFFVHAFQSAVFNDVLDRRLAAGTFDILQPGDLAFKHDSKAVFAVDDQLMESGELQPRLERFEISPSGPLWGSRMTQTSGAVGELERSALEATGLTLDDIADSELAPTGGRRPLRVQIANSQVDSGVDEHGPYIRVAFDLPSGAFATIILREIMKQNVQEHAEREGDTDSAVTTDSQNRSD